MPPSPTTHSDKEFKPLNKLKKRKRDARDARAAPRTQGPTSSKSFQRAMLNLTETESSSQTRRNRRNTPRVEGIQVGGPTYSERYSKNDMRRMVKDAESSASPEAGSFDIDPTEPLLTIKALGHRSAIASAVSVSKSVAGSQPRLVFFADGSVRGRENRGIGVVYKRLDGPESDWQTQDWIYDGFGLRGDFNIANAETLGLYCALKAAHMEIMSWIRKHESRSIASNADKTPPHGIPRVIIHSDGLSALNYFHRIRQGHRIENDTMPLHFHLDLLVPSHVGIEGNSLADSMAALAGRFAGSLPVGSGHRSGNSLFPLSTLLSRGIIKHMGSSVMLAPTYEEVDMEWKAPHVQRIYAEALHRLPTILPGSLRPTVTLEWALTGFASHIGNSIKTGRVQYPIQPFQDVASTYSPTISRKRKRGENPDVLLIGKTKPEYGNHAS
ncbi:hypothetical protein F5Y10DRAFT_293617 [Nemania abortiva]|nr:hypothetical protein F5Y10DRAFT_293617 [Nemania abortiva]